MIEEWRDVVGYEGLYQVSNLGRVKSLPKMRGFILQESKIKDTQISDGYVRCTLHLNGTPKKHLIHRLVAEAFIPNPENKPCVDHINRDRGDNRVENLRWCTYKENVLFAETYNCRRNAMKLMNENPIVKEKKRNVWLCKIVIQEDLDGNLIRTYRSASEAYRVLGYPVSAQCLGKYKTCYKKRNFKFRYADPDRDGLLIAEYARRKNL